MLEKKLKQFASAVCCLKEHFPVLLSADGGTDLMCWPSADLKNREVWKQSLHGQIRAAASYTWKIHFTFLWLWNLQTSSTNVYVLIEAKPFLLITRGLKIGAALQSPLFSHTSSTLFLSSRTLCSKERPERAGSASICRPAAAAAPRAEWLD